MIIFQNYIFLLFFILVFMGNTKLQSEEDYLIFEEEDLSIHIPAIKRSNVVAVDIKSWYYELYRDTVNNIYFMRSLKDNMAYIATGDNIQRGGINKYLEDCKLICESSNRIRSLSEESIYEPMLIKYDEFLSRIERVHLIYQQEYFEDFAVRENSVAIDFSTSQEKLPIRSFRILKKVQNYSIEEDIKWAKQFLDTKIVYHDDFIGHIEKE